MYIYHVCVSLLDSHFRACLFSQDYVWHEKLNDLYIELSHPGSKFTHIAELATQAMLRCMHLNAQTAKVRGSFGKRTEIGVLHTRVVHMVSCSGGLVPFKWAIPILL